MRLTRKKAIELCIEMWTWLAKTGRTKSEYVYPKQYLKYASSNSPDCDCWFCEYLTQNPNRLCEKHCPYGKEFQYCCMDEKSPFKKWAIARTFRARKKYAKLFLEQIKSLKG